MDYIDLLKHRRSVRSYEDKAIPKEVLEEILTDACLAPSACNKQPWRFIVINDKNLMKRLSDESKSTLLHKALADPSSGWCQFESALRNPDFNVFYNAPCLVLIVGKNDYYHFRVDCALFSTYFMLAATERGLGTCWIGLGEAIENKALHQEIGLPEDYEIVAPIIIGYPKFTSKAKERHKPIIIKSIYTDN